MRTWVSQRKRAGATLRWILLWVDWTLLVDLYVMMTMSIIYSDASLQRLHSTISINFVEPIPRRKAQMDTSFKRAREETWHTFWCSLYIHKPQQERWDPFIAPRRDGTNTSLNERGKTGGQTSMHAIYIQAAMTAQCSDPIFVKTFPVISTDRPEKTLWVSQMSVWWCGIGVIDQMAFRL